MPSKLQLSLFRPNDTCVIHNGLVFALIFANDRKTDTDICWISVFFRVHKEGVVRYDRCQPVRGACSPGAIERWGCEF